MQRASSAGGQPAIASGKAYRPDIDGLRAIAIASVVAYHTGIGLFRGGYVGVDIFFVISGYLIGGHIYNEVLGSRFNLLAFYRRRAKRILPALFAVLACAFLAAGALLSASEFKVFSSYSISVILSVSNVFAWMKQGYFDPGAFATPLLMTWSLGVEEQFYIIIPLLMVFLNRMGGGVLRWTIVTIMAVSMALSITGTLAYSNAAFFLLHARAWELSAGILLALYETDRRKQPSGGFFTHVIGVAGFALIAAAVFHFPGDGSIDYAVLAAPLSVMGTVLMLSAPLGMISHRLLSSRLMVAIGLISYSWYLWHWPMLSFAYLATDRGLDPATGSVVALLSLIPAWCSYRYIEKPFRRSQTPAKLLLTRYLRLGSALLIPGLAIIMLHGYPERFPELSAIEERSGVNLAEDKCMVPYGETSPHLSQDCVPTEDARVGVALIGDSHAVALADALREWAHNANRKFYEVTKVSCPPLLGVTRSMPNIPNHAGECARFNEQALAMVRTDASIKTVVLAGFWASSFEAEEAGARYVHPDQTASTSVKESYANLGEGLAAMVSALKASGKHVVILQDVPRFAFDPLQRIRIRFIPMRKVLSTLVMPYHSIEDNAVSRNDAVSEKDRMAGRIVANAGAAELFDPKANLCNEHECSFYAGDTLFYTDRQHLSLAGAKLAIKGLKLH